MRRMLICSLLVVSGCTGAGAVTTTAAVDSTSSTQATTTTSLATTTSTTTPATTVTTIRPLQSLAYREVAVMPFAVQVMARPGDETAYIITKGGLVWAMIEGQVQPDPVLDISDRVLSQGEQGLLSIALHPSDPNRFYLHYSDPRGDTVVSEFTFVSPLEADPT